MFNKNEKLKRIYCRIHHLLQGYRPFLSVDQVKDLDFIEIATKEEELNLLNYIIVE